MKRLFEHFVTQNGSTRSGFKYKMAPRITPTTVAYAREPEKVELLDQAEEDRTAIRVCGPFEVMSLGRYSVEDWKGYVVREGGAGEVAQLENYIEVICRLYRKNAAIQGASGLVHAVAQNEKENIAISVGPLSGRVTAKQINDSVRRTDVDIRPVGTSNRSGFETHSTRLRGDYDTRFAKSGMSFDEFNWASRYGYEIAGDEQVRGKEWSALEPSVRDTWESHNRGTWDRFKDAVRHGFDLDRR